MRTGSADQLGDITSGACAQGNPDRHKAAAKGIREFAALPRRSARAVHPRTGQQPDGFELHGKTLPKSTRVIPCVGSANRDPDVFDRPDEIDFSRERNSHIGFGVGGHYGLGAPLARLEARISIPLLFERLDGLRLADDARIRWQAGMLNRSLELLDVIWNR